MAMICHFSKPSLFITFTGNPKWAEIQDDLLHDLTATCRPYPVGSVFNLNLKDLLNQIKHKQLFGPQRSWVLTIEYQKRGLPYLHLLLFLQNHVLFLTPADID